VAAFVLSAPLRPAAPFLTTVLDRAPDVEAENGDDDEGSRYDDDDNGSD
jgi:hypothetical protein